MAISSRASAILNRHKRQHWWLQRYELFLTPQNKTRNSCSKPIVRVFFGSYPLPLTLIDCLWTMALGYSWVCSPPTFSRDRWGLHLPQATAFQESSNASNLWVASLLQLDQPEPGPPNKRVKPSIAARAPSWCSFAKTLFALLRLWCDRQTWGYIYTHLKFNIDPKNGWLIWLEDSFSFWEGNF